MKTLLQLVPLVLGTVLLCGCPDTKLPKPPPQIPEPKISGSTGPAPTDQATLAPQRLYTHLPEHRPA